MDDPNFGYKEEKTLKWRASSKSPDDAPLLLEESRAICCQSCRLWRRSRTNDQIPSDPCRKVGIFAQDRTPRSIQNKKKTEKQEQEEQEAQTFAKLEEDDVERRKSF
jgi:hypothetical protein